MAIIKVDYGTIGGGTVIDSYQVSSSSDITIQLGFKPSKLFVYKLSGTNGSPINSGSLCYVYDKDITDQTVFTMYQSGNTSACYAISSSKTSSDSLEITNNGFIIHSPSTAFYGNYIYVAIR